MSIIKNDNVALSNLRKTPVALSNLRKPPVALSNLRKPSCRLSLRPKKGSVALSILGVHTPILDQHIYVPHPGVFSPFDASSYTPANFQKPCFPILTSYWLYCSSYCRAFPCLRAPIRGFPNHATFWEKGAKLACADKLGVFLSLTLCNKANFDPLKRVKHDGLEKM